MLLGHHEPTFISTMHSRSSLSLLSKLPPSPLAGQLQLEFGINVYLKIGFLFYFSQSIA